MIEPVPAATRCASAARVNHIGAVRFTVRIACHASVVTSPTGPSPPSPPAALFTSTVRPPSASTARADQGGARLLVAQLGRDEARATAAGFDRRDDIVPTGLVASGDAHGRAFGREAGRDRPDRFRPSIR